MSFSFSFSFFLFFFFFLGAALEFCVRYMAEYPHYTNGFASGNLIMVILWNSLGQYRSGFFLGFQTFNFSNLAVFLMEKN
jgi:hypothetical protein